MICFSYINLKIIYTIYKENTIMDHSEEVEFDLFALRSCFKYLCIGLLSVLAVSFIDGIFIFPYTFMKILYGITITVSVLSGIGLAICIVGILYECNGSYAYSDELQRQIMKRYKRKKNDDF